jgi:hypothetical protein
MIEIDGLGWFLAALVICGLHVLYLRGWRRERRDQLAQWKAYDVASERRHVEFMEALTWYRRAKFGWSEKRGQA